MTDSSDFMHAWRVKCGAPDPLFRERIPIPKPSSNSLLVKTTAMGVCHSDCAIRDAPAGRPGWLEVFTLGHEGAGEVVQLGSNVSAESFRVGDRVAIHIVPGCKKCTTCKQGLFRICGKEDNGGYGLGRDGMFQEYVNVRADACVKVPDGVSNEQAAIAPDAILTAYHAVKETAGVKPDQTIAIFGLGGLGLNAVQIAQHLGVKRILVCDRKREAVDIAISLGIPAEDAFCTDGPNARPVHEIVKERNIIVDTALDFVGHEQTVLSTQQTVKPAGLIVQVGLISPTAPLIPALVASNVLTIKGSFAGEIDGLKACLDLLAEGVIRPQIQTGSINDLPQVLKDLDEGKYQGRKVLLPDWTDSI